MRKMVADNLQPTQEKHDKSSIDDVKASEYFKITQHMEEGEKLN